MFNQSVIEQIRSYVYFLRDPRDGVVFYVGKGKGNRVYDHVNCAIADVTESEKLDRIRAIINEGCIVEHFILRHGLSEQSAFEVEAAIIDFVGIHKLSNLQSGHYATDFGIKTVEEVKAMYSCSSLRTNEAVLLININKLFDRDMSADEIYNATRKSWVIGPRRNKAKYAVATYRGLTREVYKIKKWDPIDKDNKRWGFEGELAEKSIQEALRYKSIAHLAKRGAANPIRYLNC